MDQAISTFGASLRRWRRLRGLTQQTLAFDADVSARHLSWLESDRASPSRAMVLRLAERLDVPVRERNALLAQAGFAPMFRERRTDDPALLPVREALQSLLTAHEPWPAMAVNRHWELVAGNRMVPLLLAPCAEWLKKPPVNMLRVSLHPEGLAPMIENLSAVRAHVLGRLHRQAQTTADPVLAALHEELAAYPSKDSGGVPPDMAAETGDPGVVVPVTLNTPQGRLSFLTTVTVFGAPHDVSVAELAIETLLPADAQTAEALRALAAVAFGGASAEAAAT
jgi:transcriptional regulator with XRE-family HTH domain